VPVFYVNKKKTTPVLRKAGYPITGVPNISDGFIHSVTDAGSPVKLRAGHPVWKNLQVGNVTVHFPETDQL
jgi:hypothetical protein